MFTRASIQSAQSLLKKALHQSVVASLVLSTLMALPGQALAADQGSRDEAQAWTVRPSTFASGIRFYPSAKPLGQADVVFINESDSVEVKGLTVEQAKDLGLTNDEVKVLNQIRQTVLVSTLKTTLSESYSGLAIANSNEAYSLVPKAQYRTGNAKVTFNPIVRLLQTPDEQLPGKSTIEPGDVVPKKKFIERVKGYAKFLNEAIILSTIREFKNYRSKMKETAPKLDEFGLSLNFKVELQLGVGSFSFSKSGALVLDVGFNRASNELSFRSGFRREALGDGIAFPAVKFEVRAYERVSSLRQNESVTSGRAWYPPSLPALSLVLDSSDRYMAQGIAFSLNAGDFLIPGGFLLNAVNDYQEKEKRATFVVMKSRVFESLRAVVDTLLRRPRTCQALFN